MKKVLIVAQRFPPAGSVGSFRVTKFVKYLGTFGWQPVVLTVRENCYPLGVWLDHGLERDIPEGTRIYRTRVWGSRLINDEGTRWVPFLLFALFRVIQREQPRVLYLTGGPFFPLIAGPIVKLFFRLPYLIDLRDPWKLAKHKIPLHGAKDHLFHWLTNFWEPIVLRHAARVIVVTDTMLQEYTTAYPEHKSKFTVITNGFDPNDFQSLSPVKYSGFTIVYPGKFRRSEAFHDPEPFLQSIKILRERGLQIKFVHIGPVEHEVVIRVDQIGIRDCVELIGPRAYSDTLNYMVGADLLLVIGSERKMGLPVKMFDYMGCKRPILVLFCKGEELSIIAKEVPGARLLENEDPQAIAAAIEELYYNSRNLDGEADKSTDRKYHRKYLTELLAKILDQATLAAGKKLMA
jgi:glycosyltransferase involved in cell wall biosynthesis